MREPISRALIPSGMRTRHPRVWVWHWGTVSDFWVSNEDWRPKTQKNDVSTLPSLARKKVWPFYPRQPHSVSNFLTQCSEGLVHRHPTPERYHITWNCSRRIFCTLNGIAPQPHKHTPPSTPPHLHPGQHNVLLQIAPDRPQSVRESGTKKFRSTVNTENVSFFRRL